MMRKKKRLKAEAAKQVKGEEKKEEKKGDKKEKKDDSKFTSEKPLFIKSGLNHITALVEDKKAKLVVIAHDVDPIELVLWLPALCRKMDVPYCIVKGRARLGQLVHKKQVAVVAVTEVKSHDTAKLDQIIQSVRPAFNDDANSSKKWGDGVMGIKANHVTEKRKRVAAKEANKVSSKS